MNTPPLHPTVDHVTRRIIERSAGPRAAYLATVAQQRKSGPQRAGMGCANMAHTTAALPASDKLKIHAERTPHVGIVTAYNDMLSAHQPYETYPEFIRQHARTLGATAQVAGGVPAMCDGITQGAAGMELSLFSRDVIALSTAVALSHNVFDAALFLGICDKIVPGLFMGATQYGHLQRRLCARWPHDLRPVQRRQGQGAPAVRARPGGPRRLAGKRSAGLPQPRHLHLLRHRQQQPDADGNHGPAPARRQLRQPRHTAARCTHARGGATRRGQHRTHRRRDHLPGRHRFRKVHRQRHHRPGGHGRLDQPHHAPGGHGAHGRCADRLGRFRRDSPPWCRCWPACTPTAAPT